MAGELGIAGVAQPLPEQLEPGRDQRVAQHREREVAARQFDERHVAGSRARRAGRRAGPRRGAPPARPRAAPACVSSARAWPTRSSAMLASAMSSSSTGAWPHHSARRWPGSGRCRRCAAGTARPGAGSSLRWKRLHARRPHMWSTDFGQLVEGRVAVHLVVRRVEVHVLVARVAGDDLVASARPRCWCLPGAACRRRAPSGSPSAGRPRAGCRSACGRGRPCCARRLPTAATRRLRCMAHRLGWRLRKRSGRDAGLMRPPSAFALARRGPARLRAPRRRLPRPSRARPGARGCTGRRR